VFLGRRRRAGKGRVAVACGDRIVAEVREKLKGRRRRSALPM